MTDSLGNKIIPTKYYYVQYYPEAPMFVTKSINHKHTMLKGIRHINGEVILPDICRDITINNNYIYANTGASGKNYIVFDKHLKRITKNTWFAISYFDNHGLLLVKENTDDENLFFINTKGEVVIPPAKEYRIDNEFKDGYAIVQQRGKERYGLIDTTGKLVIPTVYDDIKHINGKYIWVEKEEMNMLIDHNNRIIQKFPSGVDTWSIENDPKETRYQLYNGHVYNGEGKRVP